MSGRHGNQNGRSRHHSNEGRDAPGRYFPQQNGRNRSRSRSLHRNRSEEPVQQNSDAICPTSAVLQFFDTIQESAGALRRGLVLYQQDGHPTSRSNSSSRQTSRNSSYDRNNNRRGSRR